MLLLFYEIWAKKDLNLMEVVLSKGYSSKEMYQNSEFLRNICEWK